MENSSDVLSPLDQIRLAESELTRQVTSARLNSEQRITKARLQAEQSKKEALATGNQEGQALTQEIIARAEEEARSILVQGRWQAEELTRKGRQRMKIAVQFALDIVIGTKGQGNTS
jgi:vacuolar-type H+-ATPase subunit H